MNTELSYKIIEAKEAIKDFYDKMNGKVWISFSGGKDSTVLLHLVRSLYPNTKAVFSDTGLEFFEIKQFVRTIKNVTWIRPIVSFQETILNNGVPYPSKEVATKVHEIQFSTPHIREIRDRGYPNTKNGILGKKWRYLITYAKEEGIKLNHKCCYYLKKSPFTTYISSTKTYPIVGTTKDESSLRTMSYNRFGLNIYNSKKSQSRPLMLFTEQDIWDYIHYYNLPYSKIYDMGYKRTGCMFCLMGIHMEKGKNRLEQLRETHPKQHKYILSLPKYKELLNLEGIKY